MITLILTIDDINVALKYMNEGIYKEVAPVISKIHTQAAPQIEAAKKPLEGETVES